jgi:DNA-binding NarL/FixJ family response regulator
VVIYSAYAGPALAVAARLAGADAIVDKRAPAADLVTAVRRIAAGDGVMPEIPVDVRLAALARLEPNEVPVAAMLLAGTSLQGIAETLDTDRRDVVGRARRIVGRLRPKARLDKSSDAEREDSVVLR